jgi:predicted amidohydrolase YtcJ
MCLGCHWASYRDYFAPSPAQDRNGLTRRQARRRGDKAEGLPLPPISEAVTLDAASKAATMGPAWQLGMEHEIGSIEVGKLADLVVLVVMTVMNGQVRRDQPA